MKTEVPCQGQWASVFVVSLEGSLNIVAKYDKKVILRTYSNPDPHIYIMYNANVLIISVSKANMICFGNKWCLTDV